MAFLVRYSCSDSGDQCFSCSGNTAPSDAHRITSSPLMSTSTHKQGILGKHFIITWKSLSILGKHSIIA
ncbi:hypothetical protein NE237_024400 [Protea cynaroides]|uniref:Uncharacterized protein n=1 Tax=Protea cynaroides TaxID=273540 RepID=A0A9Q0HD79_9MAGN|nr:hypothetical protein NE237_024400 [Protea cynaroides]